MRFVTNDSTAMQGRSTETQHTNRSWHKREQSCSFAMSLKGCIRPSIEKAKPWRIPGATVKSNKHMAQCQPAVLSLGNASCLCRSSAWGTVALRTIYTLNCYRTCHLGVIRNSHAADVVVGSSRHLSRTPCPMAAKGKTETPREPQLMCVLNWAGSPWSWFCLIVSS